MKIQSIWLLAMLAMLISCTKDNEPSKSDYIQLKTGNYWVYQAFEVRGDTVEELLPYTDSTYIEKDTVINGNVYFKFMLQSSVTGDYNPSFARDSAGCLVNEHGEITFSSTNFTDTLSIHTEEHLLRATLMMDEGDSVVTVPAGTFNTLFCHTRIKMHNPEYEYGVRHQGSFWAEGVGCVKQTAVSLGSRDMYIDTRLVRYHVH